MSECCGESEDVVGFGFRQNATAGKHTNHLRMQFCNTQQNRFVRNQKKNETNEKYRT